MKGKKLLILFCAVAVMAVGGFVLTRHMSSASDEGTDGKMQALFAEPRPVMLEVVRSGQATRDRTYPGTVRATREALLSFRVSGPLTAINVQPGGFVEKGQVLMEIDARDYKDNIRVLEAQLDGAKAALEKARLDYERAKPLLAEQVISQSSFDAATSGYDRSSASVKDIQARLRIARHQLGDTQLRAPFDGIISTKNIENHEMVSAGQTALAILDISSLEIETNVPESDIAHQPLKQGQEASVEFASLPGHRFPARLKEWSTAPDPATRTYAVTFAFPAPGEAQILPGMTGELLWQKKLGGDSGISVPVAAIVSDANGGSAVWVYDPATSMPSMRSIGTGELMGKDRVTVTVGLNPGERIVTAGAAFVTEGMKLRSMESR